MLAGYSGIIVFIEDSKSCAVDFISNLSTSSVFLTLGVPERMVRIEVAPNDGVVVVGGQDVLKVRKVSVLAAGSWWDIYVGDVKIFLYPFNTDGLVFYVRISSDVCWGGVEAEGDGIFDQKS